MLFEWRSISGNSPITVQPLEQMAHNARAGIPHEPRTRAPRHRDQPSQPEHQSLSRSCTYRGGDMSRRRYSFDEEKIARFYKEGRGLGKGADYKPWLNIQDVPSHGRSHRLRGMTIERLYHLLSDMECHIFHVLDWAETVQDIREQFPLDRHTTLSIAEQMKVIHPVDRLTKTSIVMTTDFVIDVVVDGQIKQIARSIKPSEDLDKPRVIEKLEIEAILGRKRSRLGCHYRKRNFAQFGSKHQLGP